MTAHAKLSASGSKKWLTCTPSASLEATIEDKGSSFAAEGTLGHALFEQALCKYLGRDAPPIEPDLMAAHYSEELHRSVNAGVDVAISRIAAAREQCGDPVIMLETRVDFSNWVPEGFGTADLIIVTDVYCEVLDLKMGAGVPVYANGNSQFRLYALGAWAELQHLYGIYEVRCGVIQPRLDNYSAEVLTVDELLEWGRTYVVPRAKLAWAGEGEFVSGDHCTSGFCKARAVCKARADANLAVIQQDFAEGLPTPQVLTDQQICSVLAKADSAIKWLTDVQAFATEQAKQGRVFDGFKLVEGRSVRRYSDPDAIAERLIDAGIPEAVIYERSLLGLTAMERTVGKNRFAQLAGDLIVKPAGNPVLVPVSDKRLALQPSAAADFT